jgi:hypothetical protein
MPIVQLYKFNTRVRKSGETVAALKALGEHSAYGEQLNDMVRDRQVCGINHRRIERRLFKKTN